MSRPRGSVWDSLGTLQVSLGRDPSGLGVESCDSLLCRDPSGSFGSGFGLVNQPGNLSNLMFPIVAHVDVFIIVKCCR